MLKKLLGLVGGAAIAPVAAAARPWRAEDAALAQAQRCADGFVSLALDAAGGDPASAFCALGALAGYACQASLRARAGAAGQPETAHLVTVNTHGGRQYFFGDPLNRLLLEEPLSLWRLAAEGAAQAGCRALPGLKPIIERTSAAVGSDTFGVIPPEAAVRAQHAPEYYLRTLWPAALALLQRDCPDPAWWPAPPALAARRFVASVPAAQDACAASGLLMEAAIPMSKLDLAAPAHPPGRVGEH